MRNFKKLSEGIDVSPLLEKIKSLPELWREINVRQSYPQSAHHSTETIFLRGPTLLTPTHYFHDLTVIDYPALYKLRDDVLPIVAPVMKKIDARAIGKVIIVKLLPHSVVDWHIDEGRYADHYSRFHVALQSNPRCMNKAENETVHFGPGESWWLNHKAPHCAINPSDKPRVHLIFDAITPKFKPQMSPITAHDTSRS